MPLDKIWLVLTSANAVRSGGPVCYEEEVREYGERFIRNKGREGRRGYALPRLDVEKVEVLPKGALRSEKPRLAEVDEPTVVRHYTNLSRKNWGIDTNPYPLGSCTMKHNPRANEAAAAEPGFAGLHPLQPGAQAQGALRVMHELQGLLSEISRLPAVSLQPLGNLANNRGSVAF